MGAIRVAMLWWAARLAEPRLADRSDWYHPLTGPLTMHGVLKANYLPLYVSVPLEIACDAWDLNTINTHYNSTLFEERF